MSHKFLYIKEVAEAEGEIVKEQGYLIEILTKEGQLITLNKRHILSVTEAS